MTTAWAWYCRHCGRPIVQLVDAVQRYSTADPRQNLGSWIHREGGVEYCVNVDKLPPDFKYPSDGASFHHAEPPEMPTVEEMIKELLQIVRTI